MARDEMQLEQIGMIPEGIWISCGYNRRFGSHWSRIRRRGGRLDINEQNINYCGPSGNYDRTVELSIEESVSHPVVIRLACAIGEWAGMELHSTHQYEYNAVEEAHRRGLREYKIKRVPKGEHWVGTLSQLWVRPA